MATAVPKAASAVTVLVSRRVKPGYEAAFEQASQAMPGAARPFQGYLGGQMVRPDAQADEEEINLYLHGVRL